MGQVDASPTRDGFGKGLLEAGKKNDKIVIVSADLEDSTRAKLFQDAFPDRAYRVGIAEQDMVGTAAGLYLQGFIPVINSFAVFLTNRAYDQIRLDLCYNDCDVKVVASHAGITVGEDGASAQCLEDIALMRVLPNMKVICPSDSIQAAKAIQAMVDCKGPSYLRLSRYKFPHLTDESTPFEIGKSITMREGNDVTLIGCGVTVGESMRAAEILEKENIQARVLNMHTIKPLDEQAVLKAAQETGAIVTAEEHQIHGGLGSAVSEYLAQNLPVPIEFIAVKDVFGETGTPEELLTAYHLKGEDIAQAAKKAIDRKSNSSNSVVNA